MKINAVRGSLTDYKCNTVIVNLFKGVTNPGGGTGAVDKALGGDITRRIKDDGFKGELGEIMVLDTFGKIPAKRVIMVGLGDSDKFGISEIIIASAKAAKKCRKIKSNSIATILHGAGIAGGKTFDCARAVALGSILGSYEFSKYKTDDSEEIEKFDIVELSDNKMPDIEKGIERGSIVGNAITFARDLANEPSNVVTPDYLASVARKIADENNLQVEILDRKDIENAGLRLLAAVARGSYVEPRFIKVTYKHPNAKKKIALLGKGITFDTGGHSLKVPSDKMYGMKDDMSGAAAVLATMEAIGKLKPEVEVVALIPSTENSIGSKAIHPGDVFKSHSGKTVEVNNTDAEGRLVLADAISYAKSLNADQIIDIATLTGGCVVALGRNVAGIFGNNKIMVDKLIESGTLCGDKMWQLPIEKDYMEKIKSDIADIKNTGGNEAAAIVGALFLDYFVEDTNWAHIDLTTASIDSEIPISKKGCTGAGTGTLIEYLLSI